VQSQPKPRKRSYKEQRELDAIPERIQLLEAEQRELQAALSDPELFRQGPAQANTSLERLQRLTAELEAAYTRWDALESLE
jgi:ATP-binding cassette subfamily F protein uup